jgi:hypothetical protein
MVQTGGGLASKENEIAHVGRLGARLWTDTMTIGGCTGSHEMQEPVEKTGRAPVVDSCSASRASRCGVGKDVSFPAARALFEHEKVCIHLSDRKTSRF